MLLPREKSRVTCMLRVIYSVPAEIVRLYLTAAWHVYHWTDALRFLPEMLMSFFIFCCCGYHENDLPDPKVMNFSLDCRLMRQKRDHDSEFMSFVHSQRGSHRPQLDALLLKPVRCSLCSVLRFC